VNAQPVKKVPWGSAFIPLKLGGDRRRITYFYVIAFTPSNPQTIMASATDKIKAHGCKYGEHR